MIKPSNEVSHAIIKRTLAEGRSIIWSVFEEPFWLRPPHRNPGPSFIYVSPQNRERTYPR